MVLRERNILTGLLPSSFLLISILATVQLCAQIKVYTAPLLGSNEVPAVMTTGTGSATITIDIAAQTMRVQATFSNFMGTTTAAHIHCCASPGNNAGVASETPSFFGFPIGVQSGTYDDTYDMTQTTSYNPTFVTANGGTSAGAFAALMAGLDAGQAYFNIHTNMYPGGEARANLQLYDPNTAAIPTLSTWGLSILSLLILIVGVAAVTNPVRTLV